MNQDPSYWWPVSHSEGLHRGPTRIIVTAQDFVRLMRLLFRPYASLRGTDIGELRDAVHALDRLDHAAALAHLHKCWRAADAAQEQDDWFQGAGFGLDCYLNAPYESWVLARSGGGCDFRFKALHGDWPLRRADSLSANGVARAEMTEDCVEVQIDTWSIDRPPMSDRERETHGYGRLGWLYGALRELWLEGVTMDVDLLLPGRPYPETVDALLRAVADPPLDRRQAAAEGRDSAPDPEPAATEAPTLTGPPVVVRKPRPRREEEL